MQKSLLLIILMLSLSSCAYLSLDGMERALAGEGKRISLLDKSVKKYHQAVYWGDGKNASVFIAPEVRNSFLRDMAERSKTEKLVEIKITDIELREKAHEAVVSCSVRYYRKPQNVVVTRLEKETWKYEQYGSGWVKQGVEEVEALENDFIELGEGIEQKDFRTRLNGKF